MSTLYVNSMKHWSLSNAAVNVTPIGSAHGLWGGGAFVIHDSAEPYSAGQRGFLLHFVIWFIKIQSR